MVDRDQSDAGSPVLVDEPPSPRFVRSWSDAVQVTVGLVVVAVSVGLARGAPDGIRAVERDLVKLFDNMPPTLSTVVVGAIQIFAVYAPLALVVVSLVLRQFRRLALVVVAAAAAWWLMRGIVVLTDTSVAAEFQRQGPRGLSTTAAFPSPVYLAVATAVATVEFPWLSRPWRRATVALLALLGVGRLASGTVRDLAVNLVPAYPAGWFAGCVVLAAVGRPNRRPNGHDVADGLARAGIGVDRVRALDLSRRYRQAFEVAAADGRRVFAKVRRGDDRASETVVRVLRYLRVREVADEHPFWSQHRRCVHEALVALKAHSDGVRTPRLLALTPVGANESGTMVAFDEIAGPSLDRLDADAFDEATLAAVWEVTGSLRGARIAHRDLNLANFVVDGAGHDGAGPVDGAVGGTTGAGDGALDGDRRAWVVDFATAVLNASDEFLANDVAELLCSTAVRVGPERAVAAAIAGVGAPAVTAALPRLQKLALSPTTRAELHADGNSELVAEVAAEARRQTRAGEVTLARLERVSSRSAVLFVVSALAFYALLPELAQAPNIIGQIRSAHWAWFLGALVASAITYVAAATALTGATPDRIPFLTTTRAEVAAQFANFATPASVGGYALNARYLQKRGTDPPAAVSAVALNAMTGLTVHVALLFAFAYWAGNDETVQFDLPGRTIAIVVAVLVALAALTLAVPVSRRFVRERLVPLVSRSLAGIAAVGRRPGKVAMLVGGAFLLTTAYIAAMVCSLQAFGVSLPLATVGVVYLVGVTVAAVAPTPGGLGAVEAALIAGFVGAGVPSATAVSAVLLFRVATFWLPLLPGWLAFRSMQHRGDL